MLPRPWCRPEALCSETWCLEPANLGSSVGVSKVRTKQEFERATRRAFRFDMKILLACG
ncbi:MAG: hypothetical protein HYU64_08290 [Armatimonadetes bacterium]|nr:hypothetical protein [Armatimonadota bacterium]